MPLNHEGVVVLRGNAALCQFFRVSMQAAFPRLPPSQPQKKRHATVHDNTHINARHMFYDKMAIRFCAQYREIVLQIQQCVKER